MINLQPQVSLGLVAYAVGKQRSYYLVSFEFFQLVAVREDANRCAVAPFSNHGQEVDSVPKRP